MDYETSLARYEALVAEHFDDKVKGKANRYTSMNGNMYSFLDKSGTLCVRLSEAGKKAYNARHGTEDVIQYGSVMRGYVAITPKIFADIGMLTEIFAECLENARSLPVKPTKKNR